ncbi:bifunctional phosphopantothenoylcysteine decarboxylase/phosphopantothenate--cysteine ligase CoaBC [bacterium 1xD8-48]|jgi:phosphopantothenoylcysteine decarboxylase/phosphopantothenate--cysteine ligase|nr:bifunctional phosphopantothenoylcysteine decarboxylase/phosphopantothenate--cysteine ligase CoaBC [Lachnospiraceae bacterium]MCI9325793.1 bifunctional phosphopantothenoylcysteine decarboxylase/phosphopantothenate--cysteine ligase CoaBC [Lachnospiraceae bacterium]NBJ98769.1 bifunctional phosphopantothenoylcysteine decarboxylase/phosphopantothenate--cysteine ligase CoaBC [bacterium 1xD8-48]
MLEGKHIVLGVTGSIAAYKIASLASMLKKKKADVTVIMTKNATNFINPITFEELTGNKCLVDTFDRNFQHSVEHVSLARQTDVFLVAPASANVIAKAAHGIADDMLTTTLLACECPKIFAPAMNTRMYRNPITQDNMKLLSHYHMEVIPPATGYLACGDTGEGKMPEPELLLEYIIKALTPKDMQGLKVLVTAGPTMEKIDPVRFISNHSTGKMGYAIARAAMLRGADVTLVTGKTGLMPPVNINTVNILSAADMAKAVKSRADGQNIIIKAAAVADYRPKHTADEKIKKKDDDMSIELERTEDILGFLGAHKKEGQFLCGFSMETENMEENSRRKLQKKNLDLIVANNLKEAGAGFGTDTNVVTLISKEASIQLPIMSKEEVAERLLSHILDTMNIL